MSRFQTLALPRFHGRVHTFHNFLPGLLLTNIYSGRFFFLMSYMSSFSLSRVSITLHVPYVRYLYMKREIVHTANYQVDLWSAFTGPWQWLFSSVHDQVKASGPPTYSILYDNPPVRITGLFLVTYLQYVMSPEVKLQPIPPSSRRI